MSTYLFDEDGESCDWLDDDHITLDPDIDGWNDPEYWDDY